MSLLFESIKIGSLELRNRIMRSATAECMADPVSGAPLPKLRRLYRALATGGAGLIVTGETFVDRSGQTHPQQGSMASDDVVSAWRDTVRPAQEAGARVMVQLNHGGAQMRKDVQGERLSPSGVALNTTVACEPLFPSPGLRSDPVSVRIITEAEISNLVVSYGQAARRAREAGFDGAQIHGAHGYLVTQFLTQATNVRRDRWGGSLQRRLRFLKEIITEVRRQVGDTYPVWIKLGVAGSQQYGLTLSTGVKIAKACVDYRIDCIEISTALGSPEATAKKGETPLLPLADAVRQALGPGYPLALVGGFRSRVVMEEVLASEVVQLISMCRPLIAEPDLPNRLRGGIAERANCTSCSQCLPREPGQGIACHNRHVAWNDETM